MSDNLENYFREQQISLQWLSFLRSLAQELSANAEAADLRQLFFRVGERFAAEVEGRFTSVETLAQLQDCLNQCWSGINWGWVVLQEGKNYIEIHHQAAPLAEAFGEEALVWSVGLLEGFYERVFKVLGAGDAMIVRRLDGAANSLHIHFHFRHA